MAQAHPVPFTHTIDAADVTPEELATLATFTASLDEGQLRDALEYLIAVLAGGGTVVMPAQPPQDTASPR